MSLYGFLDLGTAVSGNAVVTPPSGANYAAQPISFELFTGGLQLSNVNCVFGPVSGSWGTLTVFGVTDGSGTPYVAPGTLQQPFTPLNGELVVAAPGSIALSIGTQFPAGAGTVASGLVGTGNSQATAMPLPAQTNIITSAPSGIAGFSLPLQLPGSLSEGTVYVQNNDPADPAPIYPPPGTSGQISFGGTVLASGTPFMVAANGGKIGFATCSPSTLWTAG